MVLWAKLGEFILMGKKSILCGWSCYQSQKMWAVLYLLMDMSTDERHKCDVLLQYDQCPGNAEQWYIMWCRTSDLLRTSLNTRCWSTEHATRAYNTHPKTQGASPLSCTAMPHNGNIIPNLPYAFRQTEQLFDTEVQYKSNLITWT